MVTTAAHLTDHVLPDLPLRQWVLAVPKRPRHFLERDAELQGAALRLFLHTFVRRGLLPGDAAQAMARWELRRVFVVAQKDLMPQGIDAGARPQPLGVRSNECIGFGAGPTVNGAGSAATTGHSGRVVWRTTNGPISAYALLCPASLAAGFSMS